MKLLRWLSALLLLCFLLPAHAGFDLFAKKKSADELLDADQAFVPTLEVLGADRLRVRWTIADGYYLYRERIHISLPADASGATLGTVELPAGTIKNDPAFGPTAVFHHDEAVADVPLLRTQSGPLTLRLQLDYQGCNEPVGVCYPPQSHILSAELPATTGSTGSAPPVALTAVSAPATPPLAEQDRIGQLLSTQRFLALPAFFGFGLLLAFTPCVFPMIPILSGLIVGRGQPVSRTHAFMLSLIYVLAMALTYTVAGVAVASFGANLQIAFQHPAVLSTFAALFVVLALSMFGFFTLQLPSSLQTRLSTLSARQHGGEYAGVAIMGLLSALIVGPCVAPPLIGVLAVISASGDVVLGGSALFAMSLGMGVPLLVIGASAGHLLPRAGHWMERVKAVFGVLLLAVALSLLERVLPAAVSMLLWAVLLIVCATYMGAVSTLPHGAPWWRTLVKGLGLVLLIQGALLLIGVAAGGRDPLRPLGGVFAGTGGASAAESALFRRVRAGDELDAAIATATRDGRPVLLDFYADWCVSCKELERETFPDPAVRAALADFERLQVDVTANSVHDQALLTRFGLVGPPAILFFDHTGQEQRALRVVGFMPAADFAVHVGNAVR